MASATQEFSPRPLNLGDYPDPVVFINNFENASSETKEVSEIFLNIVTSDAEVIESEGNLTETILTYGDNSLADYRGKAIMAGDFQTVSRNNMF